MDLVVLILVIAVLAVVTTVGLLARPARRRLPGRQPAPGVDYAPGVGDDAERPRDTEKRTVATVDLPGADSAIGIEEPPGIVDESFPPGVEATPELLLETPAPTAGRLVLLGTRTPAELRHLLREELVRALGDYDRSMHTLPHADRPAVVPLTPTTSTT